MSYVPMPCTSVPSLDTRTLLNIDLPIVFQVGQLCMCSSIILRTGWIQIIGAEQHGRAARRNPTIYSPTRQQPRVVFVGQVQESRYMRVEDCEELCLATKRPMAACRILIPYSTVFRRTAHIYRQV